MDELITYITNKAMQYWNETADTESKIESFPSSIVDFVIEYAISCCHFPPNFSSANKIAVLDQNRTILAMACVDVYAKAGAEGEKSHNENGVQRTYESAWISQTLTNALPNYVTVL